MTRSADLGNGRFGHETRCAARWNELISPGPCPYFDAIVPSGALTNFPPPYLTLVSFNRSARAGGTGGAPCARWRAGSWRSAWGLGGKGGAPLHLAAGGGLGGAALKKLRVAAEEPASCSLCAPYHVASGACVRPVCAMRPSQRAQVVVRSVPLDVVCRSAEHRGCKRPTTAVGAPRRIPEPLTRWA